MDQMSVFNDNGSYWMTSGATKSGVPWISQTLLLPSIAREKPKSHNIRPSAWGEREKERKEINFTVELILVQPLNYLPSLRSWAKCSAVWCRDVQRSCDVSSPEPSELHGCIVASFSRSVNHHRQVLPANHRTPWQKKMFRINFEFNLNFLWFSHISRTRTNSFRVS